MRIKFKKYSIIMLAVSIMLSFTVHGYTEYEYDNSINTSEIDNSIIDDSGLQTASFEGTADVQSEIESLSSTYSSGTIKIENYEFVVKISSGYNSSTGLYNWQLNVDCVSHLVNKPDITITFSCLRDITTGTNDSYFTAVNILDLTGAVQSDADKTYTHTIDSNTDYGVNLEYATARKTAYYRFTYDIDLINSTIQVGGDGVTNTELLNLKALVWDFEYSDNLGKTLLKPRADWVRGYIVDRDAVQYRTLYFKEYKAINGIDLDTSYVIHHMQPLFLGGTHDYSNLIHLDDAFHKSIHAWFSNYVPVS